MVFFVGFRGAGAEGIAAHGSMCLEARQFYAMLTTQGRWSRRGQHEGSLRVKISGPTGPAQVSKIRAKKAAPKGGGRFAIHSPGEPPASTSVSPAAPVSRLDSLLTLQEVEERTDDRQEAVQWGNEVLDRLDDIRMGLLLGRLSRSNLLALRGKIKESRRTMVDPALKGLLDDIELRAEVELAKLENEA